MISVKKGANVPKNVAFAMDVNFIDSKKSAKCIPNKIPAIIVLLRLLLLSGFSALIKLNSHKIIGSLKIFYKIPKEF